MKTDRLLILCLFILIFFSACSNRPSWVLSDKKMVAVLYDINLAEAEINNEYNLFYNKPENKQDLLNAVFKKHKITEQQFDTSLVWFNAHIEQYFKICDHVNKLYSADIELLQTKIETENRIRQELSKVNIFKENNAFFLQSSSLLENTIRFHIDSIDWQTGDKIEISFNVAGLSKGLEPEFMCYVFCEDTILMEKETIKSNGTFIKSMPFGMNHVKSLSTTIHVSDSLPNVNIFIDKLKVIHQKSQILENAPDVILEEKIDENLVLPPQKHRIMKGVDLKKMDSPR